MIGKRIEQVTKDDVLSLLENSVREGRTLEYKECLPSNQDEEKRELLADVSALANTSGGDLIFGISETRDQNNRPTGIPLAVVGAKSDNFDADTLRLENAIRDGIAPRITGIQTRWIDGFENGPVLLVRIPASLSSPHMVTFKGYSRFFRRNSAGKGQLDVYEIRSAFEQSLSLQERVSQLRVKRLEAIASGNTPVPLAARALVALHVVPIATFFNEAHIDPLDFLDGRAHLKPLNGTGNHRLNIDGYLSYADNFEYVQIFRNGVIESVSTAIIGGLDDTEKLIPSIAIERDIIGTLDSYLKAYSKTATPPPFVVMLSLEGVRGFRMTVGSHSMFGAADRRVDRDRLLIPEVVIDEPTPRTEVALRPLFDMLWQACGYRGSPNYDAEGNWRANRR